MFLGQLREERWLGDVLRHRCGLQLGARLVEVHFNKLAEVLRRDFDACASSSDP